MDPAQRAALLGIKLRALISTGWGIDAGTLVPAPFQAGAAAVHAESSTLFVLVEAPTVDRDPMDTGAGEDARPRPTRGWLGGALVIASRQQCTQVHVMGDCLNGNDARRALRSKIAVSLWSVSGRALRPIDAVDYAASPLPPAAVLALEEQIRAAGAVPVIDHGVLRAEVLGLEVARASVDPDTGEVWLEVGVGRHDRLAQAMMHQGQDPTVALRSAVESIAAHRRHGAMSHPANQLALARWLRQQVAARPSLAGLADDTVLIPVPGTEAPELKRLSPALLFANSPDDAVLVACSVGVDLDAAIDAADTATFVGAHRIVLCIPPGDDLPALRTAAATVDVAVQVVVVPSDWAA